MNIPSFEIENDFVELQLLPGVYELVDIYLIKNSINQIFSDSDFGTQHTRKNNIN